MTNGKNIESRFIFWIQAIKIREERGVLTQILNFDGQQLFETLLILDDAEGAPQLVNISISMYIMRSPTPSPPPTRIMRKI